MDFIIKFVDEFNNGVQEIRKFKIFINSYEEMNLYFSNLPVKKENKAFLKCVRSTLETIKSNKVCFVDYLRAIGFKTETIFLLFQDVDKVNNFMFVIVLSDIKGTKSIFHDRYNEAIVEEYENVPCNSGSQTRIYMLKKTYDYILRYHSQMFFTEIENKIKNLIKIE